MPFGYKNILIVGCGYRNGFSFLDIGLDFLFSERVNSRFIRRLLYEYSFVFLLAGWVLERWVFWV
ncbi:MAG: hypothetical protein A2512_06270 [Deltaproteobacteria bacterium RIFOXYD12_FULL_56_24]|nr:MAG: hypothetical protein A2512_06270 [Deltaproteobacteria bacterium RIFOXYD12_FULL_56_24]